jgi:hypothetical protein
MMEIRTRMFGLKSRLLLLSLSMCLTAAPALAGTASATSVSRIDQAACNRMKMRGILGADPPVACDKLAVVRFSYVGFDGRIHHGGEIMVMAAAANHVQAIFDTLFTRRFPIAHARLMDHYAGDDMASMRDNNTSGFNHRPITGGKLASLHAYGLAIDINPVQNPYVQLHADGRAIFSPSAGTDYANRLHLRPGKSIRPGMTEEIVELFAHHGFLVWGGDWDNPIDYQHFQVERRFAERLATLSVEEGRLVFNDYVQRYRTCMNGNAGRSAALARINCIEKQAK